VRISLVVGVRVMLSMHGDPANRVALERKGAEQGEEIFDRFSQPKAAMRKNAVVTQRNPQRAGQIRSNCHHDDVGEMKQGGQKGRQRSDVNHRESNAGAVSCHFIHR
jgi:hypothetical protein